VFILIGAAVLIVLGLGFYLYKVSTVTGFEEKAELAAFELKSDQLDNYVGLCLRQVMSDGLRRVGQQGGWLDDPPNPFELEGYRTNVALPRIDAASPDYAAPPAWPKEGFSIFSSEPFPFSGKSLPFLCQKGGPNDARVTEYARPCPFGSYGEDSVQEDLARYAAFYLKECVRTNMLEEISGFTVEAKDPQVIVTLGEESVLAQAMFPIAFRAEGKETVKAFDFDTEIPVRLKKVFGLAEYLVSSDRFYLQFDIAESVGTPQWKTEFFDSDIIISTRCPRCSAPFSPPACAAPGACTDIINITDKLSSLEGESFSFLFARAPRPPALDWIHESSATPYGIPWDFVVVEGSTIAIEAKALDPDEDQVRFRFSGWKKDRVESWDAASCGEIGSDEGRDPFACMTARDFVGGEERMRLVAPDRIEIETKISIVDSGSGAVVEHPDLGAHLVRVEAEDEHGLKDWQDVRILVIGEPEAEAALGCSFPDAPELCVAADGTPIVSTEDPFVLDASGSIGMLGGAGFEWHFLDADGGSVADPITTSETLLTVPLGIDILANPPRASVFQRIFSAAGPHQVSLSLPDIGGLSDTVAIEVKRCLPYRAGDISLVPPYPYNRTDPFLSAHACCKADFTPAGPEKKCFEEKSYGSYFTFEDGRYLHPATGLTASPGYPVTWIAKDGSSAVTALGEEPGFIDAPGLDNDIFERTFSRSCSGEEPRRGNVCGGPASEAREVIMTGDCADFDRPGQNERCQGPPSVIPEFGAIHCEDYPPGETFETRHASYGIKDRDGGSPDGICLDIPAPSSGDGAGYNTPGPFFCVARCDGDGECRYASGCACQSAGNPSGGDSACDGLRSNLFAPGSPGAGHTSGGSRVFCSPACRTVEADAEAAACQWIVRGALPALPGLFDMGRPAERRCCGDDGSEVLTTTSGRTACCTQASSCVLPDGSCLGPGQVSGQHYCAAGTLKTCTAASECQYAGNRYCDGTTWQAFVPPRVTTDSMLCGTGPDTSIFYCGQCQASACTAKPDFCPPEKPVCDRVGAEFRCQAA
jgi:hypothetical protein